MDAAFNDEQVLRHNKGSFLNRTLKMAECRDYPETDLGEFYRQLANVDDEMLAPVGSPKELAWQLYWKLKVRTFYVRRKT